MSTANPGDGHRHTGIKVVVHAQTTLFLESLTWALIARGHIVLAASRDAHMVPALVSRFGPDLCILHADEASDCVEVARALRERTPAVKILVLSSGSTPKLYRAFDDRTVDAVVDAGCVLAQLEAALMRIVRGDRCLAQGADSPASAERLAPTLTVRERQVLERLARGATTYAIAEELSITPHTVRTHVQSLLRKLGVHGRTRAVSLALKRNLVEAGPT